MPVEVSCQRCGSAFTTSPSRVKSGKAKYCSRECSNLDKRKSVVCKHCGRTFEVPVSHPREFCSVVCARGRVRKTARVEVACQQCGGAFLTWPSRIERGESRFCSRSCLEASKNPEIPITCEECGTVFYDHASQNRRYCSRACKNPPNRIRIEGEVAYIELTNNRREPVAETVIDAADVPKVRSIGRRLYASWSKSDQTQRAMFRDAQMRPRLLPRFLLDAPDHLHCDHYDGDPLNNRRDNLRLMTQQLNNQNLHHDKPTARRKAKSGYRNVHLDKNKWLVKLKVDGKQIRIGRYDDLEEAAQAAKDARRRYFPSSYEFADE